MSTSTYERAPLTAPAGPPKARERQTDSGGEAGRGGIGNGADKFETGFPIAVIAATGVVSLAAFAWKAITGDENANIVSYFLGFGAASLLASAVLYALRRRLPKSVPYWLMMFCVVELGSAAAWHFAAGRWHPPHPLAGRFMFHPTLGAVPTPNYRTVYEFAPNYRLQDPTLDPKVEYRHNSLGLRGREPGDLTGKKVVAAVGGSTTYDVAVSTGETWPEVLGKLLGPEYAVLNFGALGHTTAEHVIMAASRLSEFKPRCVIYYAGWNDLQNAHLTNLAPDYSNFHFPMLYPTLLVDEGGRNPLRWSALYRVVERLLTSSPLPRPDRRGTISREPDGRLLSIWNRNLRLLASITRTIGATPIFVPQLLNYDDLTSDRPTDWIPFVPQSALRAEMTPLIDDMMMVGAETSTPVARQVLEEPWPSKYFVDSGHFDPAGSRRFAETIAPVVRSNCR